ncbi:hypothetical protein Rsub_01293 [Raphidocelis subcapitata]|uniref:Uncharacterized protein n=1 Tax=Raphidocelis subcapitata TaxID=307507 RepID=A0A2V0NM66_9CHLO|nr:hypothetical protein Rsub_01293 [Raphidocelis subcapitata]|eukprot:GBF88578.1 hypothetical protein Rsub_01293 [Raphidocelis subcapitata]
MDGAAQASAGAAAPPPPPRLLREGATALTSMLEAIWPPEQSPDDFLLGGLARAMTTRCLPCSVLHGLLHCALSTAEGWMDEIWATRKLHLPATKPCASDLLASAAPFIVLERAPGGADDGEGDAAADAVLVVLQLHLPPPAHGGTAFVPFCRGADNSPGPPLGTPVSAALLLAGERPALPARLPGPQVNVLPFTEAEVQRVAGFEQIWPPHRSPEDFLLFSLALYMESRAWPSGTVGVLALPVAQAGMLLTECWKARTLHRGVVAKPLTTTLLRGARPYFTIRPRANNTASGDALVALHARLWTAAASVADAPLLPQLPPTLDAAAAGCHSARGVDWTVLEAGIDATWSPRGGTHSVLKGCLARAILRRALLACGAAGCPLYVGVEAAGACVRALLGDGDSAHNPGAAAGLVARLVQDDELFVITRVGPYGEAADDLLLWLRAPPGFPCP